jgi:hypothetical protein
MGETGVCRFSQVTSGVPFFDWRTDKKRARGGRGNRPVENYQAGVDGVGEMKGGARSKDIQRKVEDDKQGSRSPREVSPCRGAVEA